MMVNFIPVKVVQNISEQISFHNIMLYLDYYQNIFIKKSYNNMVSQLITNNFLIFFYSTMHFLPFSILIWGPSWPWSYGSWIYNYQMQSVPIITDVVGSTPAQGEVYNIIW